MKNIYLILFLLFSVSVVGQNWSPLTSGNKYIFKNNEVTSIGFPSSKGDLEDVAEVYSVWVDSMEVLNGDSVFHLNEIYENVEGDLFLASTFLQNKMIKSETDGSYRFEDVMGNEIYRIRSLAEVNEIWVFDINNNINASVTQIDEMMVFGNLDSVKTIELSTGEVFQLSKNYGLLSFPDLENVKQVSLIGVEGKNVGVAVSKFEDFFNFDVGDVFQHRTEIDHPQNNASPWDPVRTVIFHKKEVIAKTDHGDSIVYEFHLDELEQEFEYNIVDGEVIGYAIKNEKYKEENITRTIYKSNNFSDLYPQELAAPYLSSDGHFEWEEDYVDLNIRIDLEVLINDNNKLTKKVHGSPNSDIGLPSLCSDGTISTSCLSDLTLYMRMRYDEGLGLVDYFWGGFESGDKHYFLEGYKKGQDTVGIVFTDKELMVANEDLLVENIDFTVYPNPANELLEISFSKKITTTSQVYLFDMYGKKVFSKKINKGQLREEVKVNELPRGIYFLSIENKDGQGVRKIMITR